MSDEKEIKTIADMPVIDVANMAVADLIKSGIPQNKAETLIRAALVNVKSLPIHKLIDTVIQSLKDAGGIGAERSEDVLRLAISDVMIAVTERSAPADIVSLLTGRDKNDALEGMVSKLKETVEKARKEAGR